MKKFKEFAGGSIKIDETKLREVEDAHGPAENMAPFVAYLATQEAAYISGAVFSVTANGRISLYSDPVPTNTIKKDDVPWTVEELLEEVPERLLKDYVSIAKINEWAT
jgi:3-oxoacyl-[acyl-carrier protein] reductase